jgi:uncharacterized protein (TIGR03000 family)
MVATPEAVPAPKDVKDAPDKPKKETSLGNRAQVIVQLPHDAQLIVDGQRVSLNSSAQPILTPALQPDRDYYYIVHARAVRNNQLVQDAQRVLVRAGHSSRVDFDLGNSTTKQEQTAQSARITVQLPENATLYVDGKVQRLKNGQQSFQTPKLETGKSYYYDFKAEAVRDGKTHSENRRVVVEAGKDVTVKFAELTESATAMR